MAKVKNNVKSLEGKFLLTEKGIDLVDVYTRPGGVLTGAVRAAQEAQEKASELMHREENELKKRELDRKSKAIEAQITASNSELEAAQMFTRKINRREFVRGKKK